MACTDFNGLLDDKSVSPVQASFQQAAASDEKTDLVSRFLGHLGDELLRDPDWQAADDHQLFLARETIEQMVMAKVSPRRRAEIE